MWAQKYRDCFPRREPEPDPNAHLHEPRVQVGHYAVPKEMLESGEWTLPPDCQCNLCVRERRTRPVK